MIKLLKIPLLIFVLEPMMARKTTVVPSCTLSALRDGNEPCSTPNRWVDGIGARARFAVYHQVVSTSTSSPPSTRSTSTAA
jgi:hypothetical protein